MLLASISLFVCIIILLLVTAILIYAWIKLNQKYKEHLALWGSILSLFDQASAELARVANKERVLMYAAEEAGSVSRIAGIMLEAMVAASAQVGDNAVLIQVEKIVSRPPAEAPAED